MINNVLFIIGNSGSGKSFITNKLTEYSMFYKLPQYTTRKQRDSERGNEYYFIDKEHYNLIADRLMSTTHINGEHYGTVPSFKVGCVGIVIVNKEGLESGINYIENVKDKNINYKVLYLKNTEPFESRESRDEEFVKNEMLESKAIIESLPADKIIEIENNPSNRTPIDTIAAMICKVFKIEFKLEKEDYSTKIDCEFLTCIFNSNGKCTKEQLKLIAKDVYHKDYVDDIEDVKDLDEELADQLLDCNSYLFNPYWKCK